MQTAALPALVTSRATAAVGDDDGSLWQTLSTAVSGLAAALGFGDAATAAGYFTSDALLFVDGRYYHVNSRRESSRASWW